jgi:hypothetical protein
MNFLKQYSVFILVILVIAFALFSIGLLNDGRRCRDACQDRGYTNWKGISDKGCQCGTTTWTPLDSTSEGKQ